jgi:hypothetical protein
MSGGSGAPLGESDGDELSRFAYQQWKKHVPLLYDMLYHHNLTHPSPCVRWGHVISEDSTTTIQRWNPNMPSHGMSLVIVDASSSVCAPCCSKFLCRLPVLIHPNAARGRIYYSERGASPNTIVVANCKIAKSGISDPMKMVSPACALHSPLLLPPRAAEIRHMRHGAENGFAGSGT